MLVSETLNKAADLIEERGWRQGAWPEGPGSFVGEQAVCLEGALLLVLGLSHGSAGREFYGCPAHNAVAAYLERHPFPVHGPIVDALWQWNDSEGRTQAEVIEVLRAAALVEASREAEVRESVTA